MYSSWKLETNLGLVGSLDIDLISFDGLDEFDMILKKRYGVMGVEHLSRAVLFYLLYEWSNEMSDYYRVGHLTIPLENSINIGFDFIGDVINSLGRDGMITISKATRHRLGADVLDFEHHILKYMIVLRSVLSCPNFSLVYKSNRGVEVFGSKTVYVYLGIRSGWSIVSDINNCRMIYSIKNVDTSPSIVAFEGERLAVDVLDNSKYSSPLWISKEGHIVDQGSLDYLSDEIDPSTVVEVINWLNSTPMVIDYPLWDRVYSSLKFDLSEKKLLIVDDEFIISDHSVMSNILVIREEIERIVKYFYGSFDAFYLSYIIDRRSRVYVKNIPINYQLFKILRGVVRMRDGVGVGDVEDVCTKLVEHFDILNILNKNKILYSQRISPNTIKEVRLDFPDIPDIEDARVIDSNNLHKFIILECMLDLLTKLGIGPASLDDIVLNGLRKFDEIRYLSKDEVVRMSDNDYKKIIEIFSIMESIKNNTKDNLANVMWFNDASSSVIQILLIKLFIHDDSLLEISNIFNNNTEYRDIYKYIESKLSSKTNKWSKFINRQVVKRKVMPGAYGQTYKRLSDEINEILSKESDWSITSDFDKKEFIDFIDKESWSCVGEHGDLISAYLKLCKKIAYIWKKECVWVNKLKMPVSLFRRKTLNRSSLRKKIGIYLRKKNETWLSADETREVESNIRKINEKLNEDDRNCVRRVIKLPNYKRSIKIRFQIKSEEVDIKKLSQGICASANHSEDAFILIKTIEKLKKLGIRCQPIHDSIGTPLIYSPIVKIMYKLSFIDFIDKSLENDCFPINLMRRETQNKEYEDLRLDFIEKYDKNKKAFKEKNHKIKEGILLSDGLFN